MNLDINQQVVTYVAIGFGVLVTLLVVVISLAVRKKRSSKKLNTQYYQEKWLAIQGMLRDKKMWSLAVIDADKLLEHALKACKYKGKTMGERLVAAQHDIKDNDLVWFGHKLRNKLVHEPDIKLTKTDTKDALLGIRAALRDLGAFDHD